MLLAIVISVFNLTGQILSTYQFFCVMIIHNKGKYGDVLTRAKEISLCIKVHIYRLNNILTGIFKNVIISCGPSVLPKTMYKRFGFIYSTK